MTDNRKCFWQSHDCKGYSAKVTIEWSWPHGLEPPQEWINRAEELAEEAFAESGPMTYDISLALRGKTR